MVWGKKTVAHMRLMSLWRTCDGCKRNLWNSRVSSVTFSINDSRRWRMHSSACFSGRVFSDSESYLSLMLVEGFVFSVLTAILYYYYLVLYESALQNALYYEEEVIIISRLQPWWLIFVDVLWWAEWGLTIFPFWTKLTVESLNTMKFNKTATVLQLTSKEISLFLVLWV